MKHRLFLSLLVLALPALAIADEASHKAAAAKLLTKMDAKNTMSKGVTAMMEPLTKQLASQGLPPAAIQEVKDAMTEWVSKLDFSLIEPKLAEAYAQEFTEDEINQLIAFYETPLGQKLLASLPVIMQKTTLLNQEMVMSKQADLQKRVLAVLSKYAPGGPGGAPAGSKPAEPKPAESK